VRNALRGRGGIFMSLGRSGFIALGMACALATSLSDAALAQAAAAGGDSQSVSSRSGVEEVVVTARKQVERLQDVPMSITALSSEDLEKSGAITLSDIAHEVPGLNVVSAAPGQNQLIIRGISSAGGIPTVGFYIDDTPIASTDNVAGAAMDPALADLERVEVLRGPQGTLYGASSMGGTVKYVTHQPDLSEQQAWFDTTVSDTAHGGLNYQFSGMLNQPIVSDELALRVVGFYRYQDGYIDRYPIDPNNYLASAPGPVAKDVNTENAYGVRAAVEFKPTDSLTITPSVFVQRMNLGAPFTFDSPPGSFSNPIQTRDVKEPSSDTLQLYSLNINDNLGWVNLTSSTSYRIQNFAAVEDDSKDIDYYLDPSVQSYVYPVGFLNIFINNDFTEEVRGSFGDGPVHGLLGVFYLNEQNHNKYDESIPDGYNVAFGTPFGNATFFNWFLNDTDQQWAVFGELNYDITSKLTLTGGLRFFGITQTLTSVLNGVFNGGLSATRGNSEDHGIDPKFEATYHFDSDVLAYITAAKGFRQGGPVTAIPVSVCGADLAALGLNSSPNSFKPDSLWNYELGVKSNWLDNRLTLNGDIYYVDWSQVQQLVTLPTCGYVFTGNFGQAVSKGAELEAQIEPVNNLFFHLGAAYNEAYLTSSVVGAQGQAGDTLENSPHWEGSASVEYRDQISADFDGFARVETSAISKQFNDFDPTSIYHVTAGYGLLSTRFGLNHDAVELSLFANNLLDKKAETALPVAYGIDLPTTRRISLNQPRTIGLELKWTP
jgi:iron complex outermembrane recepter protein